MTDKEKIDKALEIIKIAEDYIEKQRLEFLKENKNDSVDSLAKTYFESQNYLLEKLKKALTS